MLQIMKRTRIRFIGIETSTSDLKNALLILGGSFILSGGILLINSVYGLVPMISGAIFFGYGLNIKT